MRVQHSGGVLEVGVTPFTVLQEERREKDEAIMLRMSGSRKRKINTEEAVTRPGDPGWVGRARVPQVEQGEYVRRPDWQTEVAVSDTRKKGVELSSTDSSDRQ